MYLIAAVASLLIPMLGLPCGIIGLLGDRSHRKAYIFCIALTFAAIAYGYQAQTQSDIVRYWNMVDDYSNSGITLKDALQNGYYGIKSAENLWFFNLFLWLASRIREPRIIPALSTFFVYYMSLSITCRVCVDAKMTRRRMMFYIVFTLVSLNLYAIANNVRNVLAFMMIAYATFYDVYLHKRNFMVWALYILPVFIHTSAILFLVLRLFIRPMSKLKIAGLVVAISMYPILELLNPYAQKMTGAYAVVGNAIMKAYRYFNDSSSAWGLTVQASGSEKAFRFLYILIVIIFCILWILLERKDNRGRSKEYGNGYELSLINNFTFYVCLLAISCIPMLRPEYWRFSAIAIALGGGIYARSKQPMVNNYYYNIIWLLLLGIGVLGMMLWLRNLMLYTDFPLTIIVAFGSSPILILLRAVLVLLG